MTNTVSNDDIMLSDNSNLTPIQQRCIIALMATRTVKEAADQVGINIRSVFRWLNQPEFVAELRMVQQGVLSQDINFLISVNSSALNKLAWLLDHSEDERIQLEASKAVLDYTTKWFELTRINDKLEQIEETITNEHEH